MKEAEKKKEETATFAFALERQVKTTEGELVRVKREKEGTR